MAMRATASFQVVIGLVRFDVKAYKPFNEPNGGISFNQLHGANNKDGKACHNRLNQIMFCSACETKVEATDIVKGYAYDGSYLVIPAEEL
jgi:non-homologous end joining protein Ku